MKAIKFLNLLTVALVLATGAVGCKKKPTDLTNLPGSRVGQPGDLPEGGILGGGPLPDASAHAGWPENVDIFAAHTVYFAYDSTTVRAGERSKVSAVADHLRSHPETAVRVEGHCDERGTEEYNRSLGERRALAVREQLVGMGIAPGRVDTTSFGEDRPAEPGHDESAWGKNRRGVFILLTPPSK